MLYMNIHNSFYERNYITLFESPIVLVHFLNSILRISIYTYIIIITGDIQYIYIYKLIKTIYSLI